jgi:DNA-binding NarL/FixJ family response regulator
MSGTVEFQQSVRQRAISADQASTTTVALADLWSELVAGHAVIADWFFTEQRCILLLASSDARRKHALENRRREAFEMAVLGHGQKCVAIDSGIAVSTVANLCKDTLEYLNVTVPYARLPVALVAFVYACRGRARLPVARRSLVSAQDDELVVASLERPDCELSELMPPAEYSVARLCVEGYTHAEIALLRGTSPRTVANQLCAVFQKLRVSGRLEFLARLVVDHAAPSDA